MLKLKPGAARNYGSAFARNARNVRSSKSVFGRAARAARTGPAFSNRFSGVRTGRIGRGVRKLDGATRRGAITAGRAAKSNLGRFALTTGLSIGHASVNQYRASKALQAKGYSKAQIAKARLNANKSTKTRGRFRTVLGAHATNIGGQLVGRGNRRATAIGAALIGGGQLSLRSGLKAYNKDVAKRLPGRGKGAGGSKGRSAAATKGRGMSRSQAARIAAQARWHGKGRKR